VSAAEVAVTVKFEPAVEPAVYKPDVEIVPPVAVHVTAVLDDPVTVAVNCCVCPTCSVLLVGLTVTCTGDPTDEITIVNFGRIFCVPAVLTGRTTSSLLLFTSMMPWFAAALAIHDCTTLTSSGIVTVCAPTARSAGTLKLFPATVSTPAEEAPGPAQLLPASSRCSHPIFVAAGFQLFFR